MKAYYDNRFVYWDAKGNNDGLVPINEMPRRAAGLLSNADLKGDGGLSLHEIYRGQNGDVGMPYETVDSDVYRLETGGKVVEMYHVADNHSVELHLEDHSH